MLKTVFFDMDGVLVDSELHWQPVQEKLLDSLGLDWNIVDYKNTLGLSLYHLYNTLKSQYGLNIERSEFDRLYDNLAHEVYEERSKILPGFFDLVTDLKSNNIQIGLVSSSPHRWIELVINKFELHDIFKIVVSSDDVKGEGKPSPRIYRYATNISHCLAKECLAIEDSRNGALSAKNASIYIVGLRNGFNDQQDLSFVDFEAKDGMPPLNTHLLQELVSNKK